MSGKSLTDFGFGHDIIRKQPMPQVEDAFDVSHFPKTSKRFFDEVVMTAYEKMQPDFARMSKTMQIAVGGAMLYGFQIGLKFHMTYLDWFDEQVRQGKV